MDQPFARENIVAEVMEFWPQSMSVFMRHHMTCVGCPMSLFCRLDEAARAYHLDIDLLLVELGEANHLPHLNNGGKS